MNSKKGISLIVLVITIIVIIILAAAVVMSLSNNNVLTNSRTAVNESDFSEVQSSFQIKMQAILVQQLDSVVISGDINVDGFDGKGYAGTEPKDAATASTPSTISQSVQNAIKDIDIASLDLSESKFTHVAIANNKVVAIVKNGQLMVKLNKTPTNSVTDAEDGTLKITDANYGTAVYDGSKTFNKEEPDTAAVKSSLFDTYSNSTAYKKGVVIVKK